MASMLLLNLYHFLVFTAQIMGMTSLCPSKGQNKQLEVLLLVVLLQSFLDLTKYLPRSQDALCPCVENPCYSSESYFL